RQDQQIAKLELALDEALRQEALALAKLRATRESETYVHTLDLGGYQGTAQAIATRVRGEQLDFSWFPMTDALDRNPALSNSEAVELLHGLRNIRADRERELRMAWPAPGERLAPDAFVELLMAERQARAAFEHAEQRAHPGYEALVPTAKELRAAL